MLYGLCFVVKMRQGREINAKTQGRKVAEKIENRNESPRLSVSALIPSVLAALLARRSWNLCGWSAGSRYSRYSHICPTDFFGFDAVAGLGVD